MFALSGFWLQSQMDLHFQVTATLATALVTGFIALEAPGTGEPEIQKKKGFRLAVAVFAVAAAAVSIWWLRAEYSYMNLHDNFTKVPPATGYEVKKALDDCVAARPYSAFVYLSAGNYYASKRNFASAEKAYKQAMQINPAYYSIYAQLAKLEAARNNRKEAAGWAEECLKLNPYHKASKDIVAVFSLTNQTNGVN
jgi:tetratricopeptide (TPR) repeat protein